MKASKDILETNKRQRDFYNNFRQNSITKLWGGLRNGLLTRIRKNIGLEDQAYILHKNWFGDLSQKKVLDLGCFSGNYWSLYLAENSKSYLGIDLSDNAIEKFNKRLSSIPGASVKAIDFLSDEFTERDFDLVYAYGVLHHFENTDLIISRVKEILKPDGHIISYDPLQTSLPVRILRLIYRPFQSDSDWEWPFTKKTYQKYSEAFKIIERRGILGKSKWMALLNILPIGDNRRKKIGTRWHYHDWEASATSDKALFSCMHLTMLMQNKGN